MDGTRSTDRLPKQAPFSFLPPDVGVHRLPGVHGQGVRDDMVDSLRRIGIPYGHGVKWLPNDGADWRARRGKLLQGHTPLPYRTVEHDRILNTPLRARHKGWAAELVVAKNDLDKVVQQGPSFHCMGSAGV